MKALYVHVEAEPARSCKAATSRKPSNSWIRRTPSSDCCAFASYRAAGRVALDCPAKSLHSHPSGHGGPRDGADNEAARAFIAFLKRPEAAAVIGKYGYGMEERGARSDISDRTIPGLPIRLTLALASITTVLLLSSVRRSPGGSRARKRAGRRRSPRSLRCRRAAADGPRILSPYRTRAERTGGWIGGFFGGRSLAFTFEGLVIGSVIYSMPFVVQPIRNASRHSGIDRSKSPRPCAPRRAMFLDGRGAAGAAGLHDRRRPGLCTHGRRVRRRADDRGEHSGPDQGALGRHLSTTWSSCSGRRLTSWRPACWCFRSWSSFR